MGRQVNHELVRCHRALLCFSLAIYVLFHLLVVAEWRPQITLNIHSTVLQVFWDRPTRDEYRKAEETIWRHFSKLNLFLAVRILSLGSRLAFILAYARFAWNDTPSFVHFTWSGNSWYNILENTFPREPTPLPVNQPPLVQSERVLVLYSWICSTKLTNRRCKGISKYFHHKHTKLIQYV